MRTGDSIGPGRENSVTTIAAGTEEHALLDRLADVLRARLCSPHATVHVAYFAVIAHPNGTQTTCFINGTVPPPSVPE